MSIKTLTRIKIFAMIIIPVAAVPTLAVLEFRRVLPPEAASPVYLVLFFLLVFSVVRYMRRCKACGIWFAVKVISKEEINRMQRPLRNPKRKVYQVRYNVMKRCKHCGEARLYEIIKNVKV